MTDNPRYILYQSEYSIAVANKIDKPSDYIATIAGRCCESGDLVQEDAKIQTPNRAIFWRFSAQAHTTIQWLQL